MRKVVFFTMMVVFFAVCAFAQQDIGAPAKAPKQKTIEELQWQALYLQEHIKALQSDFQLSQETLKQVQDQIKRMTPTPAPKPVEKSKDEPDKKPDKK